MRYRLRTLLILLAIGPLALAVLYRTPMVAPVLLIVPPMCGMMVLLVYRTIEFMLTAGPDDANESLDD
jgi:hypothetical protein